MANTTTLLALIKEFPEPFLDPESALPPAPKVEEIELVPELPVIKDTPELTWREECEFALIHISSDPDLRRLAANLLENLSDISQLRRVWPAGSNPKLQHFNPQPIQQVLPSVWDEPVSEFELPNLPETHARQGSGDCPSGMCPIDH
jgi:hypothetical protein